MANPLYSIVDAVTRHPYVPVFSADTLAHAQAFAQSLATHHGRATELVPLSTVTPASGTTPLYTTYQPGASGTLARSVDVGCTV